MYTLHKLKEGFIITSDEEIKVGDLVIDSLGLLIVKSQQGVDAMQNANHIKKVIAQQDQIDFSALSEEEQKKIGWFDLIDYSEEISNLLYNKESFNNNIFKSLLNIAVQEGFQKAQELLSDRRFTLEDIQNAIQFGKDIRSEKSFLNENFGSPFIDYEDSTTETINYIQSLSQPKSWKIELDMIERYNRLDFDDADLPTSIEPKITDGKIKIIKIL